MGNRKIFVVVAIATVVIMTLVSQAAGGGFGSPPPMDYEEMLGSSTDVVETDRGHTGAIIITVICVLIAAVISGFVFWLIKISKRQKQIEKSLQNKP